MNQKIWLDDLNINIIIFRQGLEEFLQLDLQNQVDLHQLKIYVQLKDLFIYQKENQFLVQLIKKVLLVRQPQIKLIKVIQWTIEQQMLLFKKPLDAADAIVPKRLIQSRTDPISGRIYNSIDEVDKVVKQKLIIAPNVKKKIMQLRQKRWNDLKHLIDGTSKYASVIFQVSGDTPQINIIESVCYHFGKMNQYIFV